jgi:hypothetical protein
MPRINKALLTLATLLFWSVPLGLLFYGAGGAFGGILFIGLFIALQYPLFKLIVRAAKTLQSSSVISDR